jgi:hypothetical protein
MCADGNTRAALPRLFLRVGIMAHEWICSRSGGRIHAAPCACGTPREELWRGCDRISCRWDAQKWFSDSTDFALPCPPLAPLPQAPLPEVCPPGPHFLKFVTGNLHQHWCKFEKRKGPTCVGLAAFSTI